MIDTKKIKQQTRLALPEDDNYLYRLGIALYGFASINSFMTEIICHLNPREDRSALLDKMSGEILKKFRTTIKKIESDGLYPEIIKTAIETANLFERLNGERSDFVHAYPITNSNAEQILHRRKDSANKYYEIDNSFLNKFISELHNVSLGLYEIRNAVNPTL